MALEYPYCELHVHVVELVLKSQSCCNSKKIPDLQLGIYHSPLNGIVVMALKAFLPRCMKCWCGLALRILSVCPSVSLSNAFIVTKRKKDLTRFLYHTNDHFAEFSEKKNGWWGRPILPETWVNRPPLERNRRFWTDIRSYSASSVRFL